MSLMSSKPISVKAIRSKVALVDLIQQIYTAPEGQKIRPILVMLSAKLCGEVNRRTYVAATLVEMLHTATLIHDDVVDDAKTTARICIYQKCSVEK